MKRLAAALAAIAVLSATWLVARQTSTTPLRIWIVDVEGGKAALFVTPTGQSLLVDSGWPAANGRADRDVRRRGPEDAAARWW